MQWWRVFTKGFGSQANFSQSEGQLTCPWSVNALLSPETSNTITSIGRI